MANTFKLKTATTISGGVTHTTVYTVDAATTAVVLGLILANQTTLAKTATVTITTSVGEDPIILNAVAIPANSTLEVFSGQKLVLETGDAMLVSCSVADAIDVALSVMEIT